MRVIATGAGFRRGVRATLPLTVGLVPFGLVVGVLGQAQELSALERALMSAIVRRDARRPARHAVLSRFSNDAVERVARHHHAGSRARRRSRVAVRPSAVLRRPGLLHHAPRAHLARSRRLWALGDRGCGIARRDGAAQLRAGLDQGG
jgi:hypothetical protein